MKLSGKEKSIRAFKPDSVPLDLLKKIIDESLRAPSWANTQPWEFAIAGGKKLRKIQEGFFKKEAQETNPDVARPYEFPEPHISRMRGLMTKEKTFMTEEEFKERRRDNWRHYGAPVCIYLLIRRSFVYQEKGVNVWPLVVYPDVIRKVLGIPYDKLLVLGIAVGYPDWEKPRNKFRSDREPLEDMATFYGFE